MTDFPEPRNEAERLLADLVGEAEASEAYFDEINRDLMRGLADGDWRLLDDAADRVFRRTATRLAELARERPGEVGPAGPARAGGGGDESIPGGPT